jgi:GAF domain-containing protein
LNGTERTEVGAESAGHVAQHLADIARVLLAPGTVTETLNLIATMSVASIDGCDEAGLREETPDSGAVTTSPLVAELDVLQMSLGEGPCLDVLRGQDSVYVDDLTVDTRWPVFAPIAAEAGLRSALAYRLFAGSETQGALLLYARLPAAFNATDRAQGLIFAAHAGMALSVARTQASERGRSTNLRTALVSREIIGQAQGILMERERITADQAFDLLRRSSQRLNLKLRDVAQQLVDTGTVPGEHLQNGM